MTAYETHAAAIKTGEIDRTNVIGIRKALNADVRRFNGWSTSSTAPKISSAECADLLELLYTHKPTVVGQLAETGKAQLQNRRYKRQLADVAEIVADVQRFALVGFIALGRAGDYHVPVYRAYDSKGRSFAFQNVPWQSGGKGPEVLPDCEW